MTKYDLFKKRLDTAITTNKLYQFPFSVRVACLKAMICINRGCPKSLAIRLVVRKYGVDESQVIDLLEYVKIDYPKSKKNGVVFRESLMMDEEYKVKVNKE